MVSFAPDAMPSMQERRSESGAAAGRLSAVKRHLAANPMDKPDIGAPAEAFDRDRMAQEAIPHIIWSVSQEGARRPLITKAEENWGTVTRGNPPGHLLPADALPAARLTPETWRVEIAADPYIEPPHVRVPAEVDTAVTLDYQGGCVVDPSAQRRPVQTASESQHVSNSTFLAHRCSQGFVEL